MNTNDIQQVKYPVQTLSTALELLNYLATVTSSSGYATLAEISATLNIGKSKAHRLLNTLVAYNYVERLDKPISYRLGWGAYYVGNTVLRTHNVASMDYTPVETLCAEIQETLSIAVQKTNYALIIYRALPPTALRVQREVGYLEPLHATGIGKILLCEQTQEKIRQVLGTEPLEQFTMSTITDVDIFIQSLNTVKKNGMAYDLEEAEEGIKCIAFPIRDFTGKIVAALSSTIPSVRFTKERVDIISQKVSHTASELSRQLGYQM